VWTRARVIARHLWPYILYITSTKTIGHQNKLIVY